MATQYPELFAALIAEFSPGEVKTRPQGNQKLSYVTARVVMNRLDNVLGPENWWDEYFPMENSVLCKLSIRLQDGSVLTKSDAGGYAGMTDSGDDDKSGYSDAFKRAAVKFGIGRYLYHDGVPRFKAPTPAPPPQPLANGIPPREPYSRWVESFCESVNRKWLDHTKAIGVKKSPAEIINPHHLAHHFAKQIANAVGGPHKGPVPSSPGERIKMAEAAWQHNSDMMVEDATDYCRRQWREALAKLKPAKPSREPGDDDVNEDEHQALDAMVKEGKVPA